MTDWITSNIRWWNDIVKFLSDTLITLNRDGIVVEIIIGERDYVCVLDEESFESCDTDFTDLFVVSFTYFNVHYVEHVHHVIFIFFVDYHVLVNI